MWYCGITQSATFNGVVWCTPLGLPGRCDICMQQHSTSGIRRRIRRQHSTYWHMAQCRGVTSWVVCIADKNSWYKGKNVTIKSEIWTTNNRSLRFRDIREWVTLWRLILRSSRCIHHSLFLYLDNPPPQLGHPQQCDICMQQQHSTSGTRRRIRRQHFTYWHMTQCEGGGGDFLDGLHCWQNFTI
jgi:hypothetical protein